MLDVQEILPLFDAIKVRKSVRDYSPDELSTSLLDKSRNFIKKIPSVTGISVDFQFERSEFRIIHNLINPFGAFISVAPYFFTASVRKEGAYMLEAGYQSEHLLLFLTSLGLATCYVGGFLDFKNLGKELNLKDSKEIVILSPIGYPDNSLAGFFTGFMVDTSKMLYGTTKRKALSEILLNISSTEMDGDLLQKWENILYAVQLAPSWCNLQPWRFILQEDAVYLFVEHTSKDGVLKYESWGHDYRLFDAGIAMCHFELAAAQAGLKGKWKLLEKSDFTVPSQFKLVACWKGNLS